MPWYELNAGDETRLNELAQQYQLHPLHVEDVRSPDEGIKVDQTAPEYTFAVLKPVRLLPPAPGTAETESVSFSTIDIFAGNHAGEPFFITVSDPQCPTTAEALARARREGTEAKPARLLYLILDTIVDLYFPAVDHYDEALELMEERVVSEPDPGTLQRVFALKRELIAFRRILVATRDAALHLQRDPNTIVDDQHQPFVRDIYDHVTRLLDTIETQRDLVNNALDIYLSSVANRTNEVMKVLTVMGTVLTPAIAISGIYGMNLKGLPWEDSPHGAAYVALVTVSITVALLIWLSRRRWL